MRRRSRTLIRTLASACVVAIALAASSAVPGYLLCRASQQVHLRCCCPHAGDRDVMRAPCCEEQRRFAPDSTQADSVRARIGAPALALVALLPTFSPPQRRDAGDPLALARAGPRERLHARCSIYLL